MSDLDIAPLFPTLTTFPRPDAPASLPTRILPELATMVRDALRSRAGTVFQDDRPHVGRAPYDLD